MCMNIIFSIRFLNVYTYILIVNDIWQKKCMYSSRANLLILKSLKATKYIEFNLVLLKMTIFPI